MFRLLIGRRCFLDKLPLEWTIKTEKNPHLLSIALKPPYESIDFYNLFLGLTWFGFHQNIAQPKYVIIIIITKSLELFNRSRHEKEQRTSSSNCEKGKFFFFTDQFPSDFCFVCSLLAESSVSCAPVLCPLNVQMPQKKSFFDKYGLALIFGLWSFLDEAN